MLNKLHAVTMIAVACGVFLGGCAHQVPASPNSNAIRTPGSKLPLNIGVYFSDTFRNYQHSESKWGDTWNFQNLGQASVSQFREALDKNFASVVSLDNKPSRNEAVSKSLDVMIQPGIENYSFDIPFTKFQIYPATITYKIELFEGDEPSFSKIVHGVGDTKGSAGFDFSSNPSNSASRAIEEGVNQAVSEILASEQIHQLVERKTGKDAKKSRDF